MRTRVAIWLLSFSLCCELSASDAASAIRLGRLIDGKGKVWTNAVVLVRNGKIDKVVSAESPIPSDLRIIDLHQYTGLPGLIDVHTHMTFLVGSGGRDSSMGTTGEAAPSLSRLHGAGERPQDIGDRRHNRSRSRLCRL